MIDGYFFGYGSLANRQTHDYAQAHAATARGWRRAWRFTSHRQVAFLTVVPDAGCQIEGLVAGVPASDWAALDERERAYDKLPASDDVTHAAGDAADVVIYAIPETQLNLPDAHHPVLLSYVDVVLQGYLREYGRAGAERFLATTTGWEAPILNDRAAPRYSRAQRLTADEQAYVDAALATLGCKLLADAG